MIKELARVQKISLNTNDRCLRLDIHVEYECGGNENICGWILSEQDKDNKLIGTEFGCDFIVQFLDKMEICEIGQLEGNIVWVHGNGDSNNIEPYGLSRLKIDGTDSEPFIYSDIYNKFNGELNG